MFRAIAALALASASAHPSPALNPSTPWWERVTVTVTDDGQTQSCRYEASLRPDNAQNCSVVGSEASLAKASSSGSGGKDEVIDCPMIGNGYNYEAEEVERCVRAGLIESETMPHAESIEIMRTLDTLRAQWGVKYPGE